MNAKKKPLESGLKIPRAYTEEEGGKTTTCVNLAGCLSKKYKKRVLLVDCDDQINLTTCMTVCEFMYDDSFGYEHDLKDVHEGTDKDVIRKVRLEKIRKRRDAIVRHDDKHSPGSRENEFIEMEDVFALKNYLDEYADQHDYCIIDCPLALNDMTVTALCATNYVLAPTDTERDRINGYEMVYDAVDQMKINGCNVNIKLLGVFLNKFDNRRSLDKNYQRKWVMDYSNGEDSKIAFQTKISNISDILNAYEFGLPVHYYKARCRSAKEYNELVQEIMEKVE